MNEAIEDFITDTYLPAFIDLIRQSFSLFEAFEHQNAYAGLIDIVMDESVSDPITRGERFSLELADQLNYLLDAHFVRLTDEASIIHQVEILDALYRIQHLEDYSGIQSVLSTEEDTVDKFSVLMEDLTSKPQAYFLTILDSVDERLLSLLGKYIDIKIEDPGAMITDPSVIEQLRIFEATFGTANTAHVLVEAGMRVGYELALYIPYVKDMVIDPSDEQTALNMLSVIYMSKLIDQNPINAYRAFAEEVFEDDIGKVGRLEGQIITLMSKYNETKVVYDEKKRVLTSGA